MNKDSADNSKKLNHEEDLILLLDALQMKLKENNPHLFQSYEEIRNQNNNGS